MSTPIRLAPLTPRHLAPLAARPLAPLTPRPLAPLTPRPLAPLAARRSARPAARRLVPRSPLRLVALLSFAALSGLVAGCTATREVEATGQVQAALGTTSRPVLVEFYDLPREQGGEERMVESLRLDQPGAFSQKLAVSGDKIRVFALADADGDGACSAGEAWTTVEARIRDDDTLEPLTLTLRTQACPATRP